MASALPGSSYAVQAFDAVSHNNAFGANASGSVGWVASPGDVTLTADPFTNSAAGDYSLNGTAGGGAACKGAGAPGAFAGGTSTGSLDIGPVQSAAAAPAVNQPMCWVMA